MSALLGIDASNSFSLGYITDVMSPHSCNRHPESLNTLMMAGLCSSAVPSFEMIDPDMQIVCNLLSLVMIDITTLMIDTWSLDVSLAWSSFQFLA
jgi:hypothetical protein